MKNSKSWILFGVALSGCAGSSPLPEVNTRGTSIGSGTEETAGVPKDDTSTDTDTPDPTTSGEPARPPILGLSGDPAYDFGDVGLGLSDTARLTVTNLGDEDATGIVGRPLLAPFAYTGDGFPGEGGTCGQALAPSESCEVELSFSPSIPGLLDGTLAIGHEGFLDATLPLEGGGAGQSANLVVNPGGEETGTPPPGWLNLDLGTWTAGGSTEVGAHEGSSYLASTRGPESTDLRLRQKVDVELFASTIDQRSMAVLFTGSALELNGYSSYAMELRFLDGNEGTIDSWGPSWDDDNAWNEYSHQDLVPVGTRAIEIVLYCNSYSDSCEAGFDDIKLRVAYPSQLGS